MPTYELPIFDPCKAKPDTIKWKRMRPSTPPVPSYATDLAAGMDVRADLVSPEIGSSLRIGPGERVLVPTGLQVALPAGYELQVRPRSGLALKNGITVLNTPGTIDADYRGEIGVLLYNTSQDAFYIGHGDRIAQLVLAEVARLPAEEVAVLPPTKRALGGFGSTGVK